jgi:hypothetical protein
MHCELDEIREITIRVACQRQKSAYLQKRHAPAPQPSTLNPQPSILNPRPSIIDSKPSTIDIQLTTLNPEP